MLCMNNIVISGITRRTRNASEPLSCFHTAIQSNGAKRGIPWMT